MKSLCKFTCVGIFYFINVTFLILIFLCCIPRPKKGGSSFDGGDKLESFGAGNLPHVPAANQPYFRIC